MAAAKGRKTRRPIGRVRNGRKRSGRKPPDSKAARGARRWSARMTRDSNALDLEGGVFTLKDPKRIAASLKRSAERSTRKKANSYRSALSMLVFYINRAGRNLSARQRSTLQRAKDELRKQFKRT